MLQSTSHTTVREKALQLLQGSLRHTKAAGLAAALVPVAAVAISAAEPRSCASGGAVCGVVWQDTNKNGLRDAGEPIIEGAVVSLGSLVTQTNGNGYYQFSFPDFGTHQVLVQIPPGTQVSPTDVGDDDTIDSDGAADGIGNSVATLTLTEDQPGNASTDFGFWTSPVQAPGTGTPGYWQNHPEAWPVPSITIGGVVYSRAAAIALIQQPGKDRTLTMFSSLASAKLNVLGGNDSSCVASTIELADAWMATHGPVGSDVRAASFAWKVGEPLHRLMDNYNNGMLCAPHRD
jgi:hypothetical protein